MQSSPDNVLFQSFKLGRMQLAHRIVMAPLTRRRADKNHVHGDLAVEYYSQRASTPGTFLISEGVLVSPQAGGSEYVPGIYTTDQIIGWKRVTDAVHAQGSFIYAQLWAIGRVADPEVLAHEGDFAVVGPSAIPLEGKTIPRELSIPEIQQYVHDFAQAARNAIAAGFDGVEIHSANGYLLDQFLQDMSNERTDEYGGSIERRSRFGLEVVNAVVHAVGQDRTGVRLSPWSHFQGMRMLDPEPQFLHFINSSRNNYPDLAYLHIIDPPVEDQTQLSKSNNVFRDAWAPKPFISAYGYMRESADGYTLEHALQKSAQNGDLIAFGRRFLANPDLPRRLKEGIPLNPSDRTTFYDPQSSIGYTDYPFADEHDVTARA